MIDGKTLERVAAYAKLRMEPGDLEKINAALAMIDRIGKIPLDREEFSRGGAACELREDTPRPSMSRDDLLRNAPRTEAGCVSVPKIMGGDGQ